jgi:N12 class adenine-specific DNA methylase
MKIDYLRRRNGRRVVTFATATPIANSVTEAYVMQRYLCPDLLEAAGIEVFDSWAATFGQVVSQVELAPEGGSSFRMKAGSPGSPTSRKCWGCSTWPPTSRPPTIWP